MQSWPYYLIGGMFVLAMSRHMILLFDRATSDKIVQGKAPLLAEKMESILPVKDYSTYQYIKITQINNVESIQEYFDSCMIDIAYITETSPNTVIVRTDIGIDLTDPDDREWLLSFLNNALKTEKKALIEIIIEEPK